MKKLPLLKFLQLNHPFWVPLLFFAILLATHINQPSGFVFDEIHYAPAAERLIKDGTLLNWEHPPLAKFVFGAMGSALFKAARLVDPACAPLTIFRLVGALFGLLILFGIYRWMLALQFSEPSAKAAVWLTGFNFLWFVQSRTVMLEVYYVAFGLWGLYFIYDFKKSKRIHTFLTGWILLGCALSSKWSALPFFLLALGFSGLRLKTVAGAALSFLTYFILYLPFLRMPLADGAHFTGPTISAFLEMHRKMFDAMLSLKHATHPYQSFPWKWPLLTRPMWYHFETVNADQVRAVFASGNPALFWGTFPFLILLLLKLVQSGVQKIQKRRTLSELDEKGLILALLYFAPFIFWIVTPRSTQYFYYYFPSALWLGPIAVWSYHRYSKKIPKPMHFSKTWLLLGFVVLNAALFLYFLPILDARLLPSDRYQIYMWFRSWI